MMLHAVVSDDQNSLNGFCVSSAAVRQPSHLSDLLLPAASASVLEPGRHGGAAALRHQQLPLHRHGQLHAVPKRGQRRGLRHGLLTTNRDWPEKWRRFATFYIHFMSFQTAQIFISLCGLLAVFNTKIHTRSAFSFLLFTPRPIFRVSARSRVHLLKCV